MTKSMKQCPSFRHKPSMDRHQERQARFERLYEKHSAAVLAYALRRSAPEDAADVAAETFVVAWRRFDGVPEDETLPWLYGIARRVLSTQRRTEGRQDAVAQRVAREWSDRALSPSDTIRDVVTALAELPEVEREVLMLAAWEELSSREAAAVLGCSPTAFRIRLYRARKRLRSLLSERDEISLPAMAVSARTKESASC
jgi:RNA polymerase sigma-70 factor (ECF subfamily)